MSTLKVTARVTWLVLLLLGAADAVEVQQQNDVAYVSGGVGSDERQALEAMGGQFNLKMTCALANGPFLGAANVRIIDSKGATVLNATTNGPLFYARLKPGSYTVKVDREGRPVERTVQISEKGQQHLELTWKEE